MGSRLSGDELAAALGARLGGTVRDVRRLSGGNRPTPGPRPAEA